MAQCRHFGQRAPHTIIHKPHNRRTRTESQPRVPYTITRPFTTHFGRIRILLWLLWLLWFIESQRTEGLGALFGHFSLYCSIFQ